MKKIINFVVLFLFVVSTGYCSNESFVIKELNLELIKCPAGSFMMGSPVDEYLIMKLELPEVFELHKGLFNFEYRETLHNVTLTKSFYIGKYEVTQSQYSALMDKNPSEFIGANNPVEMVSYEDAKAFCDKMNLKYSNILPKGYKFDLPTEAQWEYACRAGTNTELNNGKILSEANLNEVAWCFGNSGKITHEVGQKKPNAWDIYDMHGNVEEWCRDWYGDYPKEDVRDPLGSTKKDKGSFHVYRGGGCESGGWFCRSASRGSFLYLYKGFSPIGFRLALVPVVQ